MKKYNEDGFESAILGGRRLSFGVNSYGRNAYDLGGLYSKVIDKPSEDALAKSFAIVGDSGQIQADIDRLKLQSKLQDVIRYCELDGGAVLIPMIKNAAFGNFSTPFRSNMNYTIEACEVASIAEFSPTSEKYSDARSPKFGQPEFYFWNGVKIHESRMIAVRGAAWAQRTGQTSPYHGRTSAPAYFKAVSDYYEAVSTVDLIMKRKQQAVHKMQGLADALAEDALNGTNENEKVIKARMSLVDAGRGILNGVVIDGGNADGIGGDSYEIKDLSLGGLDTAVGVFASQVSAVTSIPISILFGDGAKGLGATGAGDWQAYYTKLASMQTQYLLPVLERMVALLVGQQGVTGVAENWSIEFNPVYSPSEAEQAATEKTKADTLKVVADAVAVAVDMGVIEQEQVIEFFKQSGMFGLKPDTNMSEAAEYVKETS